MKRHDCAGNWLAALGPAEVLAVGAEPGERHRPPAGDLAGVDPPHRLLQVTGLRVVGGVHRQRLGVVVDRDVRTPAKRPLDPGGRTAPAGKGIHDQVGVEPQNQLTLQSRPTPLRGRFALTPACIAVRFR